MTPSFVTVATVSINQTVGDWVGTQERILQAVEDAKTEGAKLVVLPEMCITGYSLGDRLLMPGTLKRAVDLRIAQSQNQGCLVSSDFQCNTKMPVQCNGSNRQWADLGDCPKGKPNRGC